MKIFVHRQNGLFFLIFVLAMTPFGCGVSREGIEGTVTYNGKALESGSIRFVPIEGTKGPTAGSPIENGSFSVDDNKGVFVGKFRVEIEAMKLTGRQIRDDEGKLYPEQVQYIPAKYNTASTLTQEITAGQNKLTFELTP